MPSYHPSILGYPHIAKPSNISGDGGSTHTDTHVVGVRYPMEYKLGNQIAKEWTDRVVAVTDINVQQTTPLPNRNRFLAIIVDHLIKLV